MLIFIILGKCIVRQNEMQQEKIKGRTQMSVVSGGGRCSGP